eukprot:2563257-Pleurochrysis_carterae.AAC.1
MVAAPGQANEPRRAWRGASRYGPCRCAHASVQRTLPDSPQPPTARSCVGPRCTHGCTSSRGPASRCAFHQNHRPGE